MARRHKNRRAKISKVTPEQIASEIRFELRSIIRQRNSLLKPIGFFQELKNVPQDQPRYRVVFDTSTPKEIRGLKTRVKKIVLPDEKIIDDILSYAQSIWHLKDRLNAWIKIKTIGYNIEEAIRNNIDLMVCADLANRKKHGRSDNRSGVDPKLNDMVEFDTSQNGVVEFFYDGARKEKELIVSNPVPIPYKVEILKENNTVLSDNAVMYITQTLWFWLSIIDKIGFWGNDVESKEIKLMCNIVT